MRYVLGVAAVLLAIVTLMVLLGGPTPGGRPDRTVTQIVTVGD